MALNSLDDLRGLRERLNNEKKKERPAIIVCAETTCQASGANDLMRMAKRIILEKGLSEKIRLRVTGCHGLCEVGPFILTEPQNAFYTKITLENVSEIVDAVLENRYVERLLYADPVTGKKYYNRDEIPFFKYQKKLLLGCNHKIDPIRVYHYIDQGGYVALEKVLEKRDPLWIIDEIKTSGLRGRGGAGFPTGVKWEMLSRQPGKKGKYIVCNADEGDPGAYMDRSILEGNPHSVLEGMIIGAYATGATEGVIYVRNEYPYAIKHLTIALRQAHDLGLLGKNILGSHFTFDIQIVRGAGAFVCGEETALIRSVEGGMGEPRQRPPFPVEKGIYGKPTVINNVETWANVPIILKMGGFEFSKIGVKNNTGTKIFSLVGKVRNTGLVEVPMGTSIGTIVYDIGGGARGKAKIKGVQTGGPSGGCIPVSLFNLPIDYDSLSKAGSIMGSGGMIVVDENTCMVDLARYYMKFLKDESCGKCFTCRKGTQRMYERLDDITKGRGKSDTLVLLEELANVVKDSTMCGLGQSAPNPVLSTLKYFRKEYEAHLFERRCPAGVCDEFFLSPCQHACPVGMDIPAYISLIHAGRIDEAYRVLVETNPFSSICGRICDHSCEIKCRRSQVDEPVAIMHLKRFITDHAHLASVKELPITRKERIAVVGAGPSGLTAALELKKRGYGVTVFEELPEAGGMLRFGIPEYRLPRKVLNEEIQRLLDTGVELKCNTRVGRDIHLEELLSRYDKIYMAVGAHRSLKLGIPGEDAEGIYGAVEWLRKYNLGEKAPVGKNVAVIGGGNSALDAARTALRLGAGDVKIYYRRKTENMPALESEISAAQEEGIEVVELVSPLSVRVEGNRVVGLELMPMRLEGFDSSGRHRPVPNEGSQFTVKVDMIISSIGQTSDLDLIPPSDKVTSNKQGIAVDETLRTQHERIWAGGDAVTGPGWAIEAIAMGKKAAESIDNAVRSEKGEPLWVYEEKRGFEIPSDIVEDNGNIARNEMPALEASQRRESFREVELGYSLETARFEASRCIRCDVASRIREYGEKAEHKEECGGCGHEHEGHHH